MKRYNNIIKMPDTRRTRWWSKALSKDYKTGFEKINWSKKPNKGKRK
jgi:hypothetical protein